MMTGETVASKEVYQIVRERDNEVMLEYDNYSRALDSLIAVRKLWRGYYSIRRV